MKKIIILVLLIISFNSNKIIAQTYKLNYEPKGKIVKIIYDSMTFYTDTTTFFDNYIKKKDKEDLTYKNNIRELIRSHINTFKSDTIVLINRNNINKDPLDIKNIMVWDLKEIIIDLLKEKKIKVFDKKNKLVSVIKAIKISSKKENRNKRAYINKETNEELFRDFLIKFITTPAF